MVWIRRIAALLIIAGIAYGWYYSTIGEQERLKDRADRYANIIAEIWVGSAKYRQVPQQYNAFRDSLLVAYDLTEQEIREFQRRYADHPEDYLYFAEKIKLTVDSLVLIADSSIKAGEDWGIIVDSLFDTTGIDSLLEDSSDR